MFENMNRGALRQAMRDAGLPYAGLDVPGMRAALTAHAEQNAAPVVQEEIPAETVQIPGGDLEVALHPETAAELVQEDVPAQAVQEDPSFDNAVAAVVDAAAAQIAVGEETAPVVQEPTSVEIVAPAVRGTSKGLKIEKDRPMQNGVRQPSAGGMCRAVWDYCTAQRDAGTMPTVKTVKAHASSVGWNLNNASIEFYNWRKFNGISGRQ